MKYEEVSFEQEIWTKLSPQSKDFVANLLAKDPYQRMTIDQVLEHPWYQSLATNNQLKPYNDIAK